MSTNPKWSSGFDYVDADLPEPKPAERRRKDKRLSKSSISRQVVFDDKGNSILDVQVNVPRRRKDDMTIDLLECLDADSLGLELED